MKAFYPDSINVNKTPIEDTAVLIMLLQDGDGDIGQKKTGTGPFDIYIKDFRYDTGFAGYYFPDIDPKIKNPKYGINGTYTFHFTRYLLLPRTDSIHVLNGDTTHFEVYIKDIAGNESNHITTPQIIINQ
jgi:hypothetical protein